VGFDPLVSAILAIADQQLDDVSHRMTANVVCGHTRIFEPTVTVRWSQRIESQRIAVPISL
jgi:hypothetical protein